MIFLKKLLLDILFLIYNDLIIKHYFSLPHFDHKNKIIATSRTHKLFSIHSRLVASADNKLAIALPNAPNTGPNLDKTLFKPFPK